MSADSGKSIRNRCDWALRDVHALLMQSDTSRDIKRNICGCFDARQVSEARCMIHQDGMYEPVWQAAGLETVCI